MQSQLGHMPHPWFHRLELVSNFLLARNDATACRAQISLTFVLLSALRGPLPLANSSFTE
jgi:hypothetical protein